ncbi:DNA-processing protein DprA [Legionella oakridgensis]|uniref:DNA-processing protein DprA n=1 Tax=Legionella oakridgensis TaxID=29423 RepID=UPI0003DE65B3|nr:DNA-processing protein DprA [Legionella oakridgensis]ETO94034.1 DNA protecting protein DprA [Legionella oakridgensis RV-2-2007]
MNNKHYLLALNRMNQVGPRTIAKLMARWPNLEELFQMSAIELEKSGLPTRLAKTIAAFDVTQIEKDLQWQEDENHFLITWCDEQYPYLLREIYDSPPVLYVKGDLSALQSQAIAIVGSRKPTITGSETAWHFAFELAQYNITIVSGLAFGIDAQAHEGCLEAGGKTIAIMGTGIDYIYPSRHKKLAERILRNGLLITEFPLETPPAPGHFPRRNRIISGLSLSILVVEAAIRSGSLITARLALEQNRDVFAIPGSIHNPLAKGCHYLVQQGAKLVTSCEDILNELGVQASMQRNTAEVCVSLASKNQNLVKFIGFETTTVDQIVKRSGLSVEKVTCDLTELELDGIVKAVPGGYMRCRL